jgi:hypothetical protein
MIKREQDIFPNFPARLDKQDRLFLEMSVVDNDTDEAKRLVEKYGIEVPEGTGIVRLCGEWLKGLRESEKHHCQNVIDLNSQGKSIGGMQALATSLGKEAK